MKTPGRRRLQARIRSEEHTSELQSHLNLVCRLLLEKKKTIDVMLLMDVFLLPVTRIQGVQSGDGMHLVHKQRPASTIPLSDACTQHSSIITVARHIPA